MAARSLTVDARRIVRWADGFAERHGSVVCSTGPDGVLLSAADGATALLSAVPPPRDGYPATAGVDRGDGPVEALAAALLAPREVAAVLARRGGYACAVVTPDGVLASKVGHRYVQGRTAAGGWSQQRFARRRENQTDDLVRACADVAARILLAHNGFAAVLTGGDKPLAERVLADPRLSALAALPRLAHLASGDPGADVVRTLPERVRSATVRVTEP